jgi:hypothetical protein
MLEIKKREPVLSRREIIIYPDPSKAHPADFKRAVYLGKDNNVKTWMEQCGIKSLTQKDLKKENPKLLVICPGYLSKDSDSLKLPLIQKIVEKGGNLLILEQDKWPHTDWIDINIELMKTGGGGAAFFWKDNIPAVIKKGLSDADFYRFNGLPGEVITLRLTGIREPKSIWMKSMDNTDGLWESTALAEIKVGRAKAVFCQLCLAGRLDKRDGQYYDPLADIFLRKLISYLQ